MVKMIRKSKLMKCQFKKMVLSFFQVVGKYPSLTDALKDSFKSAGSKMPSTSRQQRRFTNKKQGMFIFPSPNQVLRNVLSLLG